MSEKDKQEHQQTYGQYIDNVTLKFTKKEYEFHITVGVFKKENSYAVYAGQDFKTAIVAEGKNYSEALENLTKVL